MEDIQSATLNGHKPVDVIEPDIESPVEQIKETESNKEIKIEIEDNAFSTKPEEIKVQETEQEAKSVELDDEFIRYCRSHKLKEVKTSDDSTEAQILKEFNYILGTELGHGGFGTVYKTQRTTDGLIMACKKMSLLDPTRTKRIKNRWNDLMNELFVLDSVRHVNIIGLHDQFIIDDHSYILLELADAGNLGNYVKGKVKVAPDEPKIKKWFLEICRGVQFMHQNCIAHRDIKLNNIMLSKQGHKNRVCKVTDFGLSRVCYKKTTGMVVQTSHCGTVPYMAPEIVGKDENGKRFYSAFQADIWALGVCLFTLVNKAYPFRCDDGQARAMASMLRDQKNRKFHFTQRWAGSLSPELKNLVSNLLEPDGFKRITMLGVFSHRWITEGKGFAGFDVPPSKDTKTSEK